MIYDLMGAKYVLAKGVLGVKCRANWLGMFAARRGSASSLSQCGQISLLLTYRKLYFSSQLCEPSVTQNI